MTTDQPINGTEQELTAIPLQQAANIFAQALLGSMTQGNHLSVNMPGLIAKHAIAEVTLDFLIETFCQRTGVQLSEFHAGLAQRLLALAQTFPEPNRVQLAVPAPSNRRS